jgi:hypothetical protein
MRLERWISNQNREEIHYFEDDGETYFFGFNPNMIDEDNEHIQGLIRYFEER